MAVSSLLNVGCSRKCKFNMSDFGGSEFLLTCIGILEFSICCDYFGKGVLISFHSALIMSIRAVQKKYATVKYPIL